MRTALGRGSWRRTGATAGSVDPASTAPLPLQKSRKSWVLGSPQIFLLFVLIALTGAGGAADQDETKQFGMADLAPFGAPGTSSVLDHPPGDDADEGSCGCEDDFPPGAGFAWRREGYAVVNLEGPKVCRVTRSVAVARCSHWCGRSPMISRKPATTDPNCCGVTNLPSGGSHSLLFRERAGNVQGGYCRWGRPHVSPGPCATTRSAGQSRIWHSPACPPFLPVS
jgi:hypothetical protein